MRGETINALDKAINGANALIAGPNTPENAVIDNADAINIVPTPTGLMSYK